MHTEFDQPGQRLVLTLEEASFRAWPCLESTTLDGWLLRQAQGHTRRANSVNVMSRSGEPLDVRIDAAEAYYAAAGLPAIFRITPLAEPELDGVLEERGYHMADRTLTMTGDMSDVAVPDPRVRFLSSPEPAWFDGFCDQSPVGEPHRPVLRRMLERVEGQCRYAWIGDEAEPMAFGMSVVEGERAGFFEILVSAEHRGKGLGRAILEGLVAWARDEAGAKSLWLQVVEENKPAVTLYRSFGLKPIYAYHYRILDN
ncbi:MAG: GNAT family N-acetyltransferase [Rhodospirillaceae bacterium]|nr:GNAT family N-acetyltransferase [Rhodospirillaceae bacterium]MBT6203710.1 GNAT family N-acetyltransferase [Rhodospirillaceae bacterium]MBT6512461.1 GNAT family N-acetyltransferase [Rhodospirillaceae bacterium]